MTPALSWSSSVTLGKRLKFETMECGHEPRGIRARERLRWRGPAATVA
jgi:hypothetical protein